MVIPLYIVIACSLMDMVPAEPALLVDHCGFSMVDGHLKSNCTGYYTIKLWDRTMVKECSDNVTEVFRSTVMIFWYNCSTVLLNYSKHSVETTQLYPYVLMPLIICLFTMSLIICCWTRAKLVMRVDKEEKVTLKKRGVKLVSDSSFRFLTWKQILLATCFFREVSATCMPPLHSHFGNTTWRMTFDLEEGASACFDNGIVTHSKNVEYSELGFLYNTSSWKSSVWSKTACGRADCGEQNECGYYGETGVVHHRLSSKMLYKKICKTHKSGLFSCFYLWGCWLATLEVYYANQMSYEVFEVGTTTTDDDFEVSGMNGCQIEQRNLDPIDHFGMFVVTSPRGAWLCDKVSATGVPSAGQLGDLQFLEGKLEPEFDFSAFSCEFASEASTGKCLVRSSALPLLLSNCLSLPGESSQGLVEWERGSLRTHGSSSRSFSITCPSSVALSESSHNCYSIVVSKHGIKDTGHLNYIAISAQSPDGSSSLVYNSSCGDYPIIVACDGKTHAIKILREDYRSCYPGLPDIKDETTKYQETKYVWEGGSGPLSIISHDNLLIVFAIVALLAVMMIIKCFFF